MLWQAFASPPAQAEVQQWSSSHQGVKLSIRHWESQKSDGTLEAAQKAGRALIESVRSDPRLAARLQGVECHITGPAAHLVEPTFAASFSSGGPEIILMLNPSLFLHPPAGLSGEACVLAALSQAPKMSIERELPIPSILVSISVQANGRLMLERYNGQRIELAPSDVLRLVAQAK